MMMFSRISALSLTCLFVGGVVAHDGPHNIPPPGADGKYTLTAPGITAKFIPYAASITNLIVPDRNGTLRDIVLGYDNTTLYANDPNHPDYGAVPGRYVNRIANHTYALNGTRYYTESNDGNGTLHSGTNGWSRRTWNVTAVSNTSITFSLWDKEGESLGFPGSVLSEVTHSVSEGTWTSRLVARPLDKTTPIMLTTHPYWNLDAFANPDTDLVLNHSLSLPFGKRMIGIDGDTQSTGELVTVGKGGINDFWSQGGRGKKLGEDVGLSAWVGNCGKNGGCAGYNNQWVVDRLDKGTEGKRAIARLSSEWSGIQWDLYSDQEGVVVYSCHWMGGANELKKSQGGKASNGFVRKDGCVAVEPQDWIDGINHPEWNRTAKQIYSPGGDPFTSWIQYKFSTF